MSLYNMTFGVNAISPLVLGVLELTSVDFGRFRDAYLTEDHLVVYTRCGGGNREAYEEVFEAMRDHPLYHYDEDDSFDSTYASFYFRHPEKYHDTLVEIVNAIVTETPEEKWKLLFENLNVK